jgi:deazaflavin-dependent oxidoreductase (nitroreductase family)
MTETEKPARQRSPSDDYAEFTRILTQEIRDEGRPVTGYFAGQQVLLLTTTGAKTGQRRTHPVAYSRDGDRIIVVASKGGAPTNPAWYQNLRANPAATLEMDRRVVQAHATFAEGADRDRLYAQHASVHPQFNAYPGKTDRVIPVVILEPLED